jgi:hypothetical protein
MPQRPVVQWLMLATSALVAVLVGQLLTPAVDPARRWIIEEAQYRVAHVSLWDVAMVACFVVMVDGLNNLVFAIVGWREVSMWELGRMLFFIGVGNVLTDNGPLGGSILFGAAGLALIVLPLLGVMPQHPDYAELRSRYLEGSPADSRSSSTNRT